MTGVTIRLARGGGEEVKNSWSCIESKADKI